MASYAPPTETLPLFNPTVFLSSAEYDFLTFPVAQGSETFPFGLTASSLTTVAPTTIDSLVMSDLNPSYTIDYPVNSGRIDFFSNNSVGTSIRGGKIDATGVHTVSIFDTIDEIAGSLQIGTASLRTGDIRIGGASSTGAGRTINIGTTASIGINPVNIAGSVITIGSSNSSTVSINPNTTSALNLGSSMTGGTLRIGGTVGGTTTLGIGTGTAQTGTISIGTGNTTSALPIIIGNQTGSFGSVDIGSTTITIGKANCATNNIQTSTGGTLNLKSTTTAGSINMGIGMTSGDITIGGTTGGTTTLGIGTGSAQTGTISIGTGIGTKTITIGDITATTLALAGSSITASRLACNTYTGTSMTLTPVTSLAIGGTTAANSPFFNNVGGTTSINGGNNSQGIEIGHGQTTGVINIGNITSRTGAINLGFSGSTNTLTAIATTITLGDASTTGGIISGVPFRPNFNAGTYVYSSAEIGYQTTQTPTTTAIAGAAATNLTGTFTLGNGVWMIVLRVLVNSSASTSTAFYRVGLSKTSATFENDRITDFSPNTTGDNYFVTTFVVQSSASQTWYVIGMQSGVTTTTANTNIRVQQTRIA